MRIAIVSFAGPQHGLGGLQDVLRDSALGLVGRGHDVSVITARHPDGRTTEVDSAGVEWHFANHPARLPGRPGLDPAWLRGVEEIWCRLHADRPFDALLSESTSVAPLLASSALSDMPVVLRFHGNVLGDLAAVARRLRGARSVLDIRQDLGGALWGMRVHSSTRGFRRLRGLLWISVSKQQLGTTARAFALREADGRVVPNGVDTREFDVRDMRAARHDLGLSPAGPVVVSIGRLERDKGVDIGLEAAAQLVRRHPDLGLYVVGDGSRRDDLVARARALGIESNVHFAGRASSTEVAAWLQACDVFIFPTRRAEANPVIALQALACGCAIVASCSGAVPEVVGSDGAGVLVPPGDSFALARAVEELLDDPASAAEMRTKARARAIEEYMLPAMVSGLERVLLEAVSQRRSPARANARVASR